jgi:hypothetical protein
MLCALTHDKDTVWATFLPNSSGGAVMYLHTTPALDHYASNVTLDAINYASVAKDLGILVTPQNFTERALGVWSFRGPMELKSFDELEGRLPGMWNNPFNLTCNDDSDNEFESVDDDSKFVVDEVEVVVDDEFIFEEDNFRSVDNESGQIALVEREPVQPAKTCRIPPRPSSSEFVKKTKNKKSKITKGEEERSVIPSRMRGETAKSKHHHPYRRLVDEAAIKTFRQFSNTYGKSAVVRHLEDFPSSPRHDFMTYRDYRIEEKSIGA